MNNPCQLGARLPHWYFEDKIGHPRGRLIRNRKCHDMSETWWAYCALKLRNASGNSTNCQNILGNLMTEWILKWLNRILLVSSDIIPWEILKLLISWALVYLLITPMWPSYSHVPYIPSCYKQLHLANRSGSPWRMEPILCSVPLSSVETEQSRSRAVPKVA